MPADLRTLLTDVYRLSPEQADEIAFATSPRNLNDPEYQKARSAARYTPATNADALGYIGGKIGDVGRAVVSPLKAAEAGALLEQRQVEAQKKTILWGAVSSDPALQMQAMQMYSALPPYQPVAPVSEREGWAEYDAHQAQQARPVPGPAVEVEDPIARNFRVQRLSEEQARRPITSNDLTGLSAEEAFDIFSRGERSATIAESDDYFAARHPNTIGDEDMRAEDYNTDQAADYSREWMRQYAEGAMGAPASREPNSGITKIVDYEREYGPDRDVYEKAFEGRSVPGAANILSQIQDEARRREMGWADPSNSITGI